jgi:microcystin-dependent protein
MTSVIPIGTVIPFAGGSFSDLLYDGWLPCNGQTLDPNDPDYKPLFEVIGTLYGGTGNTSFNLPDLRGLFVRGVNDGSGQDPDAELRFAIAEGAAFGDQIGSVQGYATGKPENSFTSDVPHLPGDHHKGNVGSLIGNWFASWNGDSITVTVDGGDAESRPVNAYVNYLIKFASYDDVEKIPVGGIIAFSGGGSPGAEYLLCDGKQLSAKDRSNRDIYDAIGTSNGGDGIQYFNLPDYRGRFLRSVSGPTDRDPDKDTRSAPQDDGKGRISGNTGHAVGSIQGFATGVPTGTDFTTTLSHVPTDDNKIDNIAGRSTSRNNGGSVAVNLASGGGDSETRPVNVYIDWYIRIR